MFGSAARGDAASDSDLDLLVVKAGTYDETDVSAAIYEALYGIPLPVDVVLVTPPTLEQYGSAPGLIFRQALAEGVVVYESGGAPPPA